jgi:beta-aspartyl-peptidase (threonine type)
VGAVALDRNGNLAAASSTGGLVDKLWGRVGDTPILGAGTYADNRTCAVSGTGTGEQFIRNAVAYQVSALIEYRGMALEEAARHVVHRKLKPRDGGIVAVGRDGAIALVYNTEGMYRGAADAAGRFEVRIWQD